MFQSEDQSGELGAFGRNVAMQRNVAGMTQKKLARIAGISIYELQLIEKGKKYPDPKIIESLESALSIEPGSLIEDDKLGRTIREISEETGVLEAMERLKKIADMAKPKVTGFPDLGSEILKKN